MLQLLGMEAAPSWRADARQCDPYWGAAVFARLMSLPDEGVLRVLALVMAETLAASSPLVEAAGVAIGPDVARWVGGGRHLPRSCPRPDCR